MISGVWTAPAGCGRRAALGFLLVAGAMAAAAARPGGAAARNRDARDAGDCPPTSTISPTPIRMRRKAGGSTYAGHGTFDSLNPFIVNGTVPRGLWDASFWGNNIWEALLVRNRDEPFSLYGLLAQTVDVPDDRSWIEFTLGPRGEASPTASR